MASQPAAVTAEGTAPQIFHSPTVLVIDDDAITLAACGTMLGDLHYRHHCVSSAREALALLSSDPTIGVVIASLHMASTDGFVLVEEARARIGHARSIAAVLMTDRPNTDLAVRCLHVEAVDMLAKPLAFDACAGALRRAKRYLDARRAQYEGAQMSSVTQQLAQLVSALGPRALEARAETPLSDKDVSATLRTIISSRSMRARYFPSQIFADPAWDILLDLTRARLDGQQVSVSSVCIAASVPMSTALRWVRQMVDAGLLRRWTDPKDRRRDLIALTDTTAAHMRDYLSAVHAQLVKL